MPLVVNADPTRLAQILSNLLNNASKYTDAKGEISIVIEREGDEAVIRVRDSGAGIDAKHLTDIFELFSRVESQRNQSVGGLGIGLALVKSLVEMHGGSVSVTSAGIGRGSEFVVHLPAAISEATAVQSVANESRLTPAMRSVRVLVVDDNADSADTLAMLLQLIGHDVRKAGNALEALAIAPVFAPEIGIFDIGMPGMDGYELARRMRRESWGKSMQLIALTGWGAAEDKNLAVQAGFNRHLTKPVDLAALQAELKAISGE